MIRPVPPAVVAGVRPRSLAAQAGVEAGDAIVTVGGRQLRDVVDLQFLQAESAVEVLLRKRDGTDDLVLFEKTPDEDLGFAFERPTWDDVTLCNNTCFFCFLKGLPRGMRKTLYLKDDDYRLSFLHGNFVTLTNLTEDDWRRLEEQRLSPLNVSVHATDVALRRRMLGNPNAPDVVDQLRRLGSLGIRAHTQIVLCPGVNDGAALDDSLATLTALYPTVQTVSVVPVGASPRLEERALERDGIELGRPSPEYAGAVIEQLRPHQRRCRAALDRTMVHCSDEYYVVADHPVPGTRTYDGFPQYENGIGMVRRQLDGWRRLRRRLEHDAPPRLAVKRALIAAGTLAAHVLRPVAEQLSSVTGADLRVQAITNTVFGERVNVSGLLCGRDFAAQIDTRNAELAILPRASLDYFGTRFLDDLTIAKVEAALGIPVAFASQWSEVLAALVQGSGTRPSANRASNGAMWST